MTTLRNKAIENRLFDAFGVNVVAEDHSYELVLQRID